MPTGTARAGSPPGRGETTAWRLRGPADDMSCAISAASGGYLVAMRHGPDVILRERFECFSMAMRRAQFLLERLRDRGWRDTEWVH